MKMLNKIKYIVTYIIKNYFQKVKSDSHERNRFLILSFACLIFIDYLLFCYISSKNPFDIFPAIPLLEDRKSINIYIPDIDGISIIRETRQISIPEDKEDYTRMLIHKVVNGSNLENTSIAVPVDIFIRKIWFLQDICIIDIVPSLIENTAGLIPGSEKAFKESLEKTLTENIPSIKKILILDRGIPRRNIWDNSFQHSQIK